MGKDAPLEKRVALTAAQLASPKVQFKREIGRGDCWEFVHHVLASVKAKSYYDYPKTSSDPVFAPWGELVNSPQVGYIAVFKNVEWAVEENVAVGRGTVQTQRTEWRPRKLRRHVAIIFHIRENGDLVTAGQNVKSKDDQSGAPAYLTVPVNRLSGKGEIRYYRPRAVSPGRETTSPTKRAKEAAAGR